MRRRSVDHLVPNEQRTLRAAWQLHEQGNEQLHGYLLARQLKNRDDGAPVMAYSTVYRCLDRLEQRGLIETRESQASGGPPRRSFRLTERGRSEAKALPSDERGFDIGSNPSS